jgi:exonuclease SbcD
MRICHFADNHLGAGSDHREQDILDSFAEAVDRIIELQPDLVINAGDLFHTVRPTNKVIAFASRQILRVGRDAGIPMVIIAGNHDAPKQRHIGAVLAIFRDYENVHVVYRSQYERFRSGECSVSAVPHCLNSEILREELDKIAPDPEAPYNILVLHGVVGGIKAFQMADLSEQEISASYFTRGFDYVALGHYHNYTEVQPMVFYSGSTERLSQSEAGHEKGFIEVDLKEGRTTFHPIRTRIMIDVPPIPVRCKSAAEIIETIERTVRDKKPEDSIIRIQLTDISEETYRSLPFDRIAEIKRQAYALDIRFEKEEQVQENPYADVNLGQLDAAFEKFFAGKVVGNLDKERLRKLGLDYLRQADVDED